MWDMSKPGPDPKVTDGELINAIKQLDQPYATAKDVSDITDLSRWRASQRLDRLANDNHIQSGVVGENTTVYWLKSD